MEELTPSLKLHLGRLPHIDRDALKTELARLQELFFDESGVITPPFEVVEDETLPENTFQVEINQVKLPPIESLAENEFWVFCPPSQITDPFLDRTWQFRPSVEPNTGEEAVIVVGGQEEMQIWRENGFDTRSYQGYVVFTTAAQVRKNNSELITGGLVRFYLSRLSENYPALVDIVRETFPEATLVQELRSLLSNGESIKDMPRVLEYLLARQIIPAT